MNFIDLTDTEYTFNCSKASDACEHWDFNFSVEKWDDKYITNLSKYEIKQLRENCKKILEITHGLQGGK